MTTSRRTGSGLRACLAALALWACPAGLGASGDRWLAVEVLAREGDAVRLRLTNLSHRGLHGLPARSWGYANYIKVGFEAAPLPRRRPQGQWSESRPDLDHGLAEVRWTPLDGLLAGARRRRGLPPSDELSPGAPLEVLVPFPPLQERGHMELVVLARRGPQWLTYRRTVGTRLILPGDGEAIALRGLLLLALGFLAWRGRARGGETRLAPVGVLVHSLLVLTASAALVACFHFLQYRPLAYTDGVNYAVLARSHLEGHGLRSPVIFPGFMTLVPTSREGQVFVMQAPLWPLLLSLAFRVLGATPLAVALTGYALAALTALCVFWIGYRAGGRAGAGYLGAALLMTHPAYLASVSNGSTVPLQAALVSGLVLLMWAPLRPWSAAIAGALAGLGMVARENTLFVALALAWCWWPEVKEEARPGRRRRLAAALACGLLSAAVPPALESARKAEALGGAGHPVLRATLFYGTPGFDPHWYWLYDYRRLGTSPWVYFRENPGHLWDKARDQVGRVFLRETLPTLMTPSPWFLPVVLPWLLASTRARRAAWSVLLGVGLQVAGAAVTFLHPTYFLVFVPALCALAAATLGALADRLFGGRSRWRRAAALAALAYALAPFLLNLGHVTRAGGVRVGDLHFDPRATQRLFDFVREHTPAGAVIAFGHIPAALLAWETGRTVVSYDPAPYSRPADTDMWRRLDAQLPLDFILLSSFTDAETSDVLEGFTLVAQAETRWLRAWLFGRTAPQAGAGPSGGSLALPRQPDPARGQELAP